MTADPRILLIDDEPGSAALPAAADVVELDPKDVQFGSELTSELVKADLVLIDHNLHLAQELSLTAIDGAGFVGNLRSWARENQTILPPLIIYTSEDEAFADEIPTVGPPVPLGGSFLGREAQLAPTLDVEWLIAKDEDEAPVQIEALARAFTILRDKLDDEKASLTEIATFLGQPAEVAWNGIAFEQIARSRPPISEPGSASIGTRGATTVLRWLLHRAMPYPGLFVSDLYAAWSLGIQPEALPMLEARAEGHPWVGELLATHYSGPAKELFNGRWWAAGIEFCTWRLREKIGAGLTVQAAIDELAGPGLPVLPAVEQVVVVDLDFKETGLAPIEEAVQIHPRGWPAEAAEPWMRRDLVQNEPLAQSMVDPLDSPAPS